MILFCLKSLLKVDGDESEMTSMNGIGKTVIGQLKMYKNALIQSERAGRKDNVILIKAQIQAYRIGLETALNNSHVAEWFKFVGLEKV